MTTDQTATISLAQQRRQILTLLSQLFAAAPEVNDLRQLLDLLQPLNSALNGNIVGLNQGIARLHESLQHLEENESKESELELQRDYSRLFCVGLNTVATTASAILSPQRLHKREPWVQVRAFYQRHGWQAVEQSSVLDDSLSAELAFYTLLIDPAGDTEASLQSQRDFLEQHILTWVPEFCTELKRSAENSSVFQALACLLEGYLEVERALVYPQEKEEGCRY